uniref:Alpha-tubulin suppressor n=1 Tax=Triatoma dimidiata TaxID=72491 RepID=A0A0V0GAN5_TRIDM
MSSSKRKAGDVSAKKAKKNKKNGRSKDDDLSDFEDEFKSDVDGDVSDVGSLADEQELESELGPDDGLRVQGPDHIGRLLLCGATNWDLYNRKQAPKGCKNTAVKNIYTPHRFGPLDHVRIRAVASGCSAAHSVIITEDYKVYTLGRNEKGQLGTGDTEMRSQPYFLESMKDMNVVNASCGRNHTLLLTDRGTVYAMGDNKMGQCGVGNSNPNIMSPTRIRYRGPPIVKVVCGGDFSMILDLKGNLHSFGDPEYGQLGHNSSGEYFVTATKLTRAPEKAPKQVITWIEKTKDHVTPVEVADIVDIACGTNHTVVLDSRRRVFTWGFGGYGRLGHAEPKDEMIPRLVKFFETQGKGIKAVYCGSQFSIAVSEYKMAYLFGKTKNTGDVNMYPKPIQDLSGWSVRSLGAGTTSVVIAADNSTIAFGASPCFGELGHGEMRKSTSVPMEVKALDGVYIEQVAMGQAHTLFIARDSTPEEKERVEQIPVYTP